MGPPSAEADAHNRGPGRIRVITVQGPGRIRVIRVGIRAGNRPGTLAEPWRSGDGWFESLVWAVVAQTASRVRTFLWSSAVTSPNRLFGPSGREPPRLTLAALLSGSRNASWSWAVAARTGDALSSAISPVSPRKRPGRARAGHGLALVAAREAPSPRLATARDGLGAANAARGRATPGAEKPAAESRPAAGGRLCRDVQIWAAGDGDRGLVDSDSWWRVGWGKGGALRVRVYACM